MTKSDEMKNGVEALRSEKYFLPIESKKKYQEADLAWWSHPIVIVLITLSFTGMDGLVLFGIFDIVMTQSENMGLIMSYGIALVLNVIPLLVAKFVHQAIYGIKRYALLWTIINILAFVILFSSTVYLRFAYQDYYDISSSTEFVNSVGLNDEMKSDNTKNDTSNVSFAIVLLLSVAPLVTSLINFSLAYLSDDELKKCLNALEIRNLELNEVISDCQAALETMDYDRLEMLNLDENNLNCAKDSVIAKGEKMMALARLILAEHLANPSATTKLSNEKLNEQELNKSSDENELKNLVSVSRKQKLNVAD